MYEIVSMKMSDAHRHTLYIYKLADQWEKKKELNAIVHSLANVSLDIRINENDRECLSI